MAVSLYDLSVGSYKQTTGAVAGFLARGLDHFRDANTDPDSLVETRLAGDMLPFKFQIWSVNHHSIGAIEGVKKGVFTGPADMPATMTYADLQKVVAETREALDKLTPGEVDALEGKDVVFQFRDFKMPFVAKDFLMSFSLPNFYFHSTTAYDILRHSGVPLGKRDFMGALRLKT